MKSSARPELPIVMDCSAPLSTRPDSTYKSGKVVQTNGTTSVGMARSDPVIKYQSVVRKGGLNRAEIGGQIFKTDMLEHAHARDLVEFADSGKIAKIAELDPAAILQARGLDPRTRVFELIF